MSEVGIFYSIDHGHCQLGGIGARSRRLPTV